MNKVYPITFEKYILAGFDTLKQVTTDRGQEWVCGFLCRGPESEIGEGLICFMPMNGQNEAIRGNWLSPVCETPEEAIMETYDLFAKHQEE